MCQKTHGGSRSEKHYLFDKLAWLNEDQENRNFRLAPLCVLTYLFDGRHAIPASAIVPVAQRRRDWTDNLKQLSHLGLLDVYLDADGNKCVAFGKPPPDKSAPSKEFVDSDLRDLIVQWTLKTDNWFNDIFGNAVKAVEVFNEVGGSNDFPSLNTLHRLLNVYTKILYWQNEEMEAGETPSKAFKASVIVAFGKMLLSKAR